MSTNIHSEGGYSEGGYSGGSARSPSGPEFERESHVQAESLGSIKARSESEPYLRAEVRCKSGARVETINAASQPSRLWLWFVAAFVIQAAAWTAWFVIASHNKVQEVPLATTR